MGPTSPRTLPRATPIVLAMLLLPALPFGTSAAEPEPVLVAILDTGVDATHPEFDPGQLVGWKDFVNARPAPYDDNGHGTATASLAVGNNRGSCGASPKTSFAPGRQFVMAKVLDAAGSGSSDVIDGAIDWAVAQGADVISISIGADRPLPVDLAPAFERAHAAGVLVVVAAGNGAGNLGLAPIPSWGGAFGNEMTALVVGGGTRTGTLTSTTGNTDPDVASWSDSVCSAKAGGGYVTSSGTSLSAPLVAGMAASVMQAARDAGKTSTAARITDILTLSASNNQFSPYAREGLGHLLDDEAARAIQHATAGTSRAALILAYDAQGAHAPADRAYHVTVKENLQVLSPNLA